MYVCSLVLSFSFVLDLNSSNFLKKFIFTSKTPYFFNTTVDMYLMGYFAF